MKLVLVAVVGFYLGGFAWMWATAGKAVTDTSLEDDDSSTNRGVRFIVQLGTALLWPLVLAVAWFGDDPNGDEP